MKLLDKHTLIKMCKVTFLTLLFLLLLKNFVLETYTISTSQMESTLLKGDEVLVSKLSYGPRTPNTLLTIPFFQKIYTSLIHLPYYRLFPAYIHIDDIVLFNSPVEVDIPLDKRTLIISRCIAIPGDTVKIMDDSYFINNKQYIHSPAKIQEYISHSNHIVVLNENAHKIGIDIDFTILPNDSLSFKLSRYDAYILYQSTGDSVFYRITHKDVEKPIYMIVPEADRQVILTKNNIKIYRQAIEYENPHQVRVVDDKLYINDSLVDIYTFREDYYWFLSDNSTSSLDSRNFGFIPYSCIDSRVMNILYSYDKGFKKDRFFRNIK